LILLAENRGYALAFDSPNINLNAYTTSSIKCK